MAKCKGCGVELLEGTVFCPYCGTQVLNEQPQESEVIEVQPSVSNDEFGTPEVTIVKKENGAFKVFAILGMILGIVVLSFTGLTILTLGEPFAGLYLSAFALEFSVPGLIFSAIGKKSVSKRGKATFGFIVNLICLILSFILLFVCAFLFVAEGGSTGDFTGGYYF